MGLRLNPSSCFDEVVQKGSSSFSVGVTSREGVAPTSKEKAPRLGADENEKSLWES